MHGLIWVIYSDENTFHILWPAIQCLPG